MGSLLEFRDLGEVAQTLRACFLLPKMATVVEATSEGLLVALMREFMEPSSYRAWSVAFGEWWV